tara:strand:- start:11537 stop:11878 length:342 start_codon:yes stop_codon:yes gene_type:complete
MKFAFVLALVGTTAAADTPEIVDARATQTSGGWQFDVTVAHPDTGWDHYADGWAVEDAAGNQLGLRVLVHPHVAEQPFTRGMAITADLPDVVYIRGRCNVDGWSDERFDVTLR